MRARASTSWIEDSRLKIISQLFQGFFNLQSSTQDVLARASTYQFDLSMDLKTS